MYNIGLDSTHSAYDLDPLDPQDLGFLDPDPRQYADLRGKILTKYWTKMLTLKTQTIEKMEIIKISSFLICSLSFSIKIRKKETKFENFALL